MSEDNPFILDFHKELKPAANQQQAHDLYVERFGSDPVEDSEYVVGCLSEMIAEALQTNKPIKKDGKKDVIY